MDFIDFLPSENNYRLRVPLGSEFYLFDVRWNSRDNIDPATGRPRGAWYFDLRDNAEEPIALGIKVVLGPLLGRGTQHAFFAQHVLQVIDTSGERRDAGYDDLGRRVQVVHMTMDEFRRQS